MTKLVTVILGVSALLVSQGAWAACGHIADKSSQEYKDCIAKSKSKSKLGPSKAKCFTGADNTDKQLAPTAAPKSAPSSATKSGVADTD